MLAKLKTLAGQVLKAVKAAVTKAALLKALGLFLAAVAAQVAALNGTSHLDVKVLGAAVLSAAYTAAVETWPVLRQIRAAAKRSDVK